MCRKWRLNIVFDSKPQDVQFTQQEVPTFKVDNFCKAEVGVFMSSVGPTYWKQRLIQTFYGGFQVQQSKIVQDFLLPNPKHIALCNLRLLCTRLSPVHSGGIKWISYWVSSLLRWAAWDNFEVWECFWLHYLRWGRESSSWGTAHIWSLRNLWCWYRTPYCGFSVWQETNCPIFAPKLCQP